MRSHVFEPQLPDDYRYSVLRFFEQTTPLEDHDPRKYMVVAEGVVEYTDPATDAVVEIGAFSCHLVDGDGALNAHVSAYEVYDTTQGTFDLYQDLFDIDNDELLAKTEKAAYGKGGFRFNCNMLIIERLVIYPEYRGNGLGLVVMRALMHRFSSFADLFVIKPYPLQSERSPPTDQEIGSRPREGWKLEQFTAVHRTATARLRKHYAKLGFKLVPKTLFMICNSQNALPAVDTFFPSRAGDSKSPSKRRAGSLHAPGIQPAA